MSRLAKTKLFESELSAYPQNQPGDVFSYATFSAFAGPVQLKTTCSPTEFKHAVISQQLAQGALAVILVRHGRSIANERSEIKKYADLAPSFTEIPNHEMPLTDLGIRQAEATGRYLAHMVHKGIIPSIDTIVYSPYQRTQETLEHLLVGSRSYCRDTSLPLENVFEGGERARTEQRSIVRERNWGDFESLDGADQHREYRERTAQPFHWVPYGSKPGETMAEVSERASQFMQAMYRPEFAGKVVLVVTHGEFMNAVELTVRRLNPYDQGFEQSFERGIPNCGIMMISRTPFSPQMPIPTESLRGFKVESRVVPFVLSDRDAQKFSDWSSPTWEPIVKETRSTIANFRASRTSDEALQLAQSAKERGIATQRVTNKV
jgi:probable phosphoglycerate mutase